MDPRRRNRVRRLLRCARRRLGARVDSRVHVLDRQLMVDHSRRRDLDRAGRKPDFGAPGSRRRRFVMTYVSPLLGSTLFARTATAPEEPWSSPTTLGACGLASAEPGAFCSGGRQLSRALFDCRAAPDPHVRREDLRDRQRVRRGGVQPAARGGVLGALNRDGPDPLPASSTSRQRRWHATHCAPEPPISARDAPDSRSPAGSPRGPEGGGRTSPRSRGARLQVAPSGMRRRDLWLGYRPARGRASGRRRAPRFPALAAVCASPRGHGQARLPSRSCG